MRQVESPPATVGFWDLFGLHFTGVFLVIFLLAHVWAVHYAVGGEPEFTFEAVRPKLQSPLFTFLDLGLLALAIYHGLTGFRRFLVDLEAFSRGALRVITWVLVLIGLGGLYYGWLIYRAFVG